MMKEQNTQEMPKVNFIGSIMKAFGVNNDRDSASQPLNDDDYSIWNYLQFLNDSGDIQALLKQRAKYRAVRDTEGEERMSEELDKLMKKLMKNPYNRRTPEREQYKQKYKPLIRQKDDGVWEIIPENELQQPQIMNENTNEEQK